LATKRLRIRCEEAGFTLRFTVRTRSEPGGTRVRVGRVRLRS
jgi:hypothetical protein